MTKIYILFFFVIVSIWSSFAVNAAQATALQNIPNGIIHEVECDLNYLYIAGAFTKCGSYDRPYLARFFRSSLRLDTSWNPVVTGPILSIELTTQSVVASYYGGIVKFPINGEGVVSPQWSVSTAGQENFIQVSGAYVYVNGFFYGDILYRLDLVTGDVDTQWKIALKHHTYERCLLEFDRDYVYIAGSLLFDQGMFRGVRRVSKSGTGTIDPSWSVSVSSGIEGSPISSIKIVAEKLYIAGAYDSIASVAKSNLARVSLGAQSVLDTLWNNVPHTNSYQLFKTSGIVSMGFTDHSVIVIGPFDSLNGVHRKRVAEMSLVAKGNVFQNSVGDRFTIDSISAGSGAIHFGGVTYSWLNDKVSAAAQFVAVYDSLKISAPYAGSLFAASDSVDIEWTGVGKMDTVVIDYSTNNGAAWQRIVSNASGNLYRWKVPKVESDQCKIRVSWNGQTAGDRDLNFNSQALNGGGWNAVQQPDGKILVGGQFSSYGSYPANRLIRLNRDASVDTTFKTGTGFDNLVGPIAVQKDGKILVGGQFTTYQDALAGGIIRLQSDGAIDASFSSGFGFTGSGGNVGSAKIVIQNDGRILVVGEFNNYNGVSRNFITRLLSSSAIDNSFAVGSGCDRLVGDLVLQPDGKVVLAGLCSAYNGYQAYNPFRVNSDGSRDNSYKQGQGYDAWVGYLTRQTDGKMLGGGQNMNYDGNPRMGVARSNADGTLDVSFAPKFTDAGRTTTGYALQQSDGKILICGNFNTYDGTSSRNFVRVNDDGTIDRTMVVGSGIDSSPYSLLLSDAGHYILVGPFLNYRNLPAVGIVGVIAQTRLAETDATNGVFSIAIPRVSIPDLSFGKVTSNASRTDSISITCTSKVPAVLSIYRNTQGSAYSNISSQSFTVLPNQTKSLALTFKPTGSGQWQDSIVFETQVGDFFVAKVSGLGEAPVASSLAIVFPNGSESFYKDDVTRIQWTGVNESDTVTLEYSTDNGTSWNLISSKATGLYYDWSVPALNSQVCLLRVSLSSNSFVTLKNHSGEIRHIEWNNGNTKLATSGLDNKATIWWGSSGQILNTLAEHTEYVWDVRFCPDGTKVITASYDSTAKIWDVHNNVSLFTLKGHGARLWRAAWSPDGTKVATASDDKTAKIWDATTGALLHTLSGHTQTVWDLRFSPDGTQLATASVDYTARTWDVNTGQALKTFNSHTASVFTVRWNNDGSKLLTASQDNSAIIWNTSDATVYKKLNTHSGRVFFAEWSPDDTKIATCSNDSTARVFDATTGSELKKMVGHGHRVLHVAWNPDGTKLATGSDDFTAKVWDVASAAELSTFDVKTSSVLYCDWSEDGNTLATTAGTDARLWNVNSLQDVSDSTFAVFTPTAVLKTIFTIKNFTACASSDTTILARTVGGVKPYNYIWTFGNGAAIPASDIVSGGGIQDSMIRVRPPVNRRYRCVVRDPAFGADTAFATVYTNPSPTLIIQHSGSNVICEGDSVRLDLISAANYDAPYRWSNGSEGASIYVNAAGSYTVTADSGGCTATSAPIVVTVTAKPSATVTQNGDELHSSSADSYQWLDSSGTAISGATNRIFTPTKDGRYSVRVTTTGCTNTSAFVSYSKGGQPSSIVVSDLDFGKQVVSSIIGRRAPLRSALRVRNDGGSEVSVDSIRINSTVFKEARNSYPKLVPPGVTLGFSVDFTPDAVQSFTTSATVYVGNVTSSATLRGEGIDLPKDGVVTEVELVPDRSEVNPGDTLKVTIRIADEQPKQSPAVRFRAALQYDARVLDWIQSPNQFFDSVSQRTKFYTLNLINGRRVGSTTSLATILFRVKLSEADSTTLLFTDTTAFTWEDANGKVFPACKDSIVRISVCKEGGKRLVTTAKPTTLHSIAPNPVDGSATISYTVGENSPVEFVVSDLFGREVLRIVETPSGLGDHKLMLDSDTLKNGTYFLVLQNGVSTCTQKFEVVK